MKIPRLSIAAVMTLVLLVALNLGVIAAAVREAGNDFRLQLLVLGALPMANILVIAAAARSRRRRRGGSTPFLTAFLIVGTIALFGFVAAVLVSPEDMRVLAVAPIVDLYAAFLDRTGLGHTITLAITVAIPLLVTGLTLPQVLLASAAGWASRRLRSGDLPPRETDANHPAPPTSSML